MQLLNEIATIPPTLGAAPVDSLAYKINFWLSFSEVKEQESTFTPVCPILFALSDPALANPTIPPVPKETYLFVIFASCIASIPI